MPITPGGRFSPGDADDYDLVTDLAAMQVSNEMASATEISAIPRTYAIGTNAERLALGGVNLFKGLRFFATDTNLEWRYSGTAWQYAPGQVIAEATKPFATQVIGSPNAAPGTEVTGVELSFTLSSAQTLSLTGLLSTYSATAGDIIQVKIRDNTTDLRIFTGLANSGGAGTSTTHPLTARLALAAGAHRLNIAVLRVVGSTGAVTIPSDASSTSYMYLMA